MPKRIPCHLKKELSVAEISSYLAKHQDNSFLPILLLFASLVKTLRGGITTCSSSQAGRKGEVVV